jgi:AraC-like DNA-binding protein
LLVIPESSAIIKIKSLSMRKKNIGGSFRPIERTKLFDVPALELAKSFIDKDPAIHIRVSNLADKAGINDFKLKLGFRELFEISPYQCRLRLCLKKGKQLLEETDDTIDQISAKVGFNTCNGFSAAFKKVCHLEPTIYRNQIVNPLSKQFCPV